MERGGRVINIDYNEGEILSRKEIITMAKRDKFNEAMMIIDEEAYKLKYALNKDSYEHKLSDDELAAISTKYYCLCELMDKLREQLDD